MQDAASASAPTDAIKKAEPMQQEVAPQDPAAAGDPAVPASGQVQEIMRRHLLQDGLPIWWHYKMVRWWLKYRYNYNQSNSYNLICIFKIYIYICIYIYINS